MDLPSWLSISLFALIVGGGSYVLRRVLRWRGLTKDQMQWAVFSIMIFFIFIVVALQVLGIG